MQNIVVHDANGNSMNSIVQWDIDVYVYIENPGISEKYPVHFFNTRSELALVMESTFEDGVLKTKIPNSLAQMPYPITGYVSINDKSEYGFKLNVINKPKPSDIIEPNTNDYLRLSTVLEECREYAASIGDSAQKSEEFAKKAQSYAVGGTGTREEEATDNAKYYWEQTKLSEGNARKYAEQSNQSATDAEQSAKDADLSATSAEASNADAAKHEQAAKGSADAAAQSAEDAAGSAAAAQTSADESEASSAEALSQAEKAAGSASEAEAHNQSAEDAAARAKASETAAALSETNAGNYAADAEASKNAAAESATAAQTSEGNAQKSAGDARAAADNIEALLEDIMSDRLFSTNFTANIPDSSNAGWAQESSLFCITIECAGVLDTDNPFIDITMSGNVESDDALKYDWKKITMIETGSGTLKIYATKKPDAEIPIRIKVVR